MACKKHKLALKFCIKDVNYAQRLVLDVLVYTLPKFGVPDTELPFTNCHANVYNRANFLEIAGATTLGISLVMRDSWRRMFESRVRSSGINNQNVSCFLLEIMRCCPLFRRDGLKSFVEVSLALGNEMMLFVRHKRLLVQFNTVVTATATYILCEAQLKKEGAEIIEELFDSFGNLSEYTRWITDFIKKFAIPYESSQGVSDIFLRDDVKKHNCEEEVSNDLNNISGSSSSENCVVNLVESNLRVAVKSPMDSSESGTVEGEESDRCQSIPTVNAVAQTSHSEGVSRESPVYEIDDAFCEMSLGVEVSHNREGTIPKRKRNSEQNEKTRVKNCFLN